MMITTATPRTAVRTLRGWPLFIVLSLLFHLLLFLLLTRLTPAPSVANHTITPFAVQIETAPAAQVEPAPTPTPAPAAVVKPVAAPPARTATPAPSAAKPALTAPPPAAARTPRVRPEEFDEFDGGTGQRVLDVFPDAGGPINKPSEESDQPELDEESRLQIESLIRTRFADHFHYPALAQHHGWQGEVLLAFRVEPDGTIGAIEVVRSSGYAILDQAAIESMRAIEQLEFAPGLRLQRMLELSMPVIYHLAQS